MEETWDLCVSGIVKPFTSFKMKFTLGCPFLNNNNNNDLIMSLYA